MIICPYKPEEYFRDIMEVCLCDSCVECTLKCDIFDGLDPIDAYSDLFESEEE